MFLAVSVNTSEIRAASGSVWHGGIEKEGNTCRCREINVNLVLKCSFSASQVETEDTQYVTFVFPVLSCFD